MNELWRRLHFLLHRKQFDQDLAEEMQLHVRLRAATNRGAAVDPSQAESAARRRFGNMAQIGETGRGVWGWSWLEALIHDARYGLRTLAANPGFAATAVLSLALGIGANTAIFSIVNAVMLRSLPVEDPRQLVQLQSDGEGTFTNPIWEEVRDRQQAFSGTFAYSENRFDLANGGESHYAAAIWVSGDFFRVLGVPAMRGRVITTDDDLHGGGHAGPVAVLSYRFWKLHYAGDPSAVGKTIRLDRHPFVIVGITPPWFTGLDVDRGYDVAIPIGCEPMIHTDQSALAARSWWWLHILGRLKPGEPLPRAEARMKALAPEVNRATLPKDWDANGQRGYLKRSFSLTPAATGFSGIGHDYRTALFTLMVVVGLVLLIACANIANLLLARAAAREREISVRMAIGAARGRVIRQLLTESLILSLSGAAGGLLFAIWGSNLLVRLLSKTGSELQLDVAPDLRVLAFTAGIAILTGLVFGLAPALRATDVNPNQILKEHARGLAASRSRLAQALVTVQVALSLVLLVGAGLFLGTLRNLLHTDLGFDQRHILLVQAGVMQANIPKPARVGVYATILDRLRRIPGVASAASSTVTPIGGSFWNGYLSPEGYKSRGEDDTLVFFNRVSPGYFATLRTPLLIGRDFSDSDTLSAPKVTIIDETTAHRFFGKTNPVGKAVLVDAGPGAHVLYQVIGVVKAAKYGSVDEKPKPLAYFPISQDPAPWADVSFEIRSESPAGRLIPSIRSTIGTVNRGISLQYHAFDTQVSESLLQPKIVAMLSAFFGGLALLLAMIGLYGVTAYGVARRQGEIGIRMALGAQSGSVIWLVLRDVILMLVTGTALGLAASLAAGRLVATLLYGVKWHDAAPLILAALALSVAAGIAAYLPARRAARLDPMTALREE
jgi:putative ABC transport system permease protein